MEPRLVEVAVILKAHGLRGELHVDLWSDLEDRLAPGTVLQSDRGPFTVTSSRRQQQRWLCTFEGIATREVADAVRGTVLRAEPVEVDGVLWVHELVGSTVATSSGEALGTVTAVEANPASDLLVTSTGALIPSVFIVESEPGVSVVVDVPEGLLEL